MEIHSPGTCRYLSENDHAEMKRLSIIIVTYNSEKDIYDCLDSIKQYSDINAEELEIIVVDNNSRRPPPLTSDVG